MEQKTLSNTYENFCKKLVSNKEKDNPFSLLKEFEHFKVFGIASTTGEQYQIGLSPIQTEVRDANTGRVVAKFDACIKSKAWLLKLVENLVFYSQFFQNEENADNEEIAPSINLDDSNTITLDSN